MPYAPPPASPPRVQYVPFTQPQYSTAPPPPTLAPDAHRVALPDIDDLTGARKPVHLESELMPPGLLLSKGNAKKVSKTWENNLRYFAGVEAPRFSLRKFDQVAGDFVYHQTDLSGPQEKELIRQWYRRSVKRTPIEEEYEARVKEAGIRAAAAIRRLRAIDEAEGRVRQYPTSTGEGGVLPAPSPYTSAWVENQHGYYPDGQAIQNPRALGPRESVDELADRLDAHCKVRNYQPRLESKRDGRRPFAGHVNELEFTRTRRRTPSPPSRGPPRADDMRHRARRYHSNSLRGRRQAGVERPDEHAPSESYPREYEVDRCQPEYSDPYTSERNEDRRVREHHRPRYSGEYGYGRAPRATVRRYVEQDYADSHRCPTNAYRCDEEARCGACGARGDPRHARHRSHEVEDRRGCYSPDYSVRSEESTSVRLRKEARDLGGDLHHMNENRGEEVPIGRYMGGVASYESRGRRPGDGHFRPPIARRSFGGQESPNYAVGTGRACAHDGRRPVPRAP